MNRRSCTNRDDTTAEINSAFELLVASTLTLESERSSITKPNSSNPLQSELNAKSALAWRILYQIDNIPIRVIRDSISASNDPFHSFQVYLRNIGLGEYADAIKPYHLNPFKNGSITNQDTRAEILAKKSKRVLEERFDGDILRFVTEVQRSELIRPFIDRVIDVPVPVRTSTCMEREGKLINALRTILKELGFEELSESIQEYHLAKPSGIYTTDDSLKISLLCRKFDSMLPVYGNDVVKMLCEFDLVEFIKPLKETLYDPKSKKSLDIEIETSTINALYNGDRWRMIQDYLTAKGFDDIKRDLRKYHLRISPEGLYSSDEGKEFLRRHLDAIRANSRYRGNINKFSSFVTLNEIEQPFVDTIGGIINEDGTKSGGVEVQISTLSLTRHYKSSPQLMIQTYLGMQRRKIHLERFDPTHRSKVQSGQNQDMCVVRDTLFRKLDHLLKNFYNNDLRELKRRISRTAISTPFKVRLNNRDSVRIVTATAWRAWEANGGDLNSLLEEFEKKLRQENSHAQL